MIWESNPGPAQYASVLSAVDTDITQGKGYEMEQMEGKCTAPVIVVGGFMASPELEAIMRRRVAGDSWRDYLTDREDYCSIATTCPECGLGIQVRHQALEAGLAGAGLIGNELLVRCFFCVQVIARARNWVIPDTNIPPVFRDG